MIIAEAIAVAAVAFLYSAVGHGGATGYLAVLTLFGLSREEMAATALVLNTVVAGLSFQAYYRQGEYRAALIWPYLAASVPLAFLGARLSVDKHFFAMVLALALVLAGLRFLLFANPAPGPATVSAQESETRAAPPLPLALLVGAVLGLLSGITGIGGGVFLSPLLIFCGWASTRQTACASALFIVANSLSGLSGRYMDGHLHVTGLWYLLLAAIPAALLGSRLGAGAFTSLTLRRLLAVVLIIAAMKLLFFE